MLPSVWVAGTKPEVALRRAKGDQPWRGGGWPLAPRDRWPEAGMYRLERHELEVDRAAHLAGDLREPGEPLLERRVRPEELGADAPPVRRHDEERVHALNLAQVALGDLRQLAGDALERGHQVLGRAGDQRRAAVGRVLAVPRDHQDQDVA